MNKVMLAVVGVMAIGLSASAEYADWFNGGIASDWPAQAIGGAWTNTTDQAEWDATAEAVVVSTLDSSTAVAFTNLTAKTAGSDAQLLKYGAGIKFCPFTSLPDVPDGAKAGVIAVTNIVEAVPTTNFYVLAKVESANAWVKTDIETDCGSSVNLSVVVSNLTGSAADGVAVTYTIGSTVIEKTVAVSSLSFSSVNFTGDGEVKSLTGQYDNAVTLTLPAQPGNVQSTVVSNKTTGAVVEGTSGVYAFAVGDGYAVWYYAKSGYLFSDGKDYKVTEGTMSGNVDLSTTEPANPSFATAKIGSQLYLTPSAAVTAASAGDTVVLLADVAMTSSLTVDKAILIDFDGYKLESSNDAVPVLSIGAAVIIDNAIITNNATVATVTDGASLVISNGIFKGAATGTAAGAVTVYGGYYIDTTGWDANTVAYGGKFTGDTAPSTPEAATDYQYTQFAIPVETNGVTFTWEVMKTISGASDSSKVWSVETTSGEKSIGGIQITDTIMQSVDSNYDPNDSNTYEAAQAKLNESVTYGTGSIKKWERAVLGMDMTTTSEGPCVTGVQDANASKVTFKILSPNLIKAAESGCDVKFQVTPYTTPDFSGTPGTASDKVDYTQSVEIPLPSKDDGVRYYKLQMFISTKK